MPMPLKHNKSNTLSLYNLNACLYVFIYLIFFLLLLRFSIQCLEHNSTMWELASKAYNRRTGAQRITITASFCSQPNGDRRCQGKGGKIPWLCRCRLLFREQAARGGLGNTLGCTLYKERRKTAGRKWFQTMKMRTVDGGHTHRRMRDEDFGLVAIILLFHFLSRDRLESDFHHGLLSVVTASDWLCSSPK